MTRAIAADLRGTPPPSPRPMTPGRLPRSFFARPAPVVAPHLLNKLLVVAAGRRRRVGRIVEVEAYAGGADPASHAYRGQTTRNSVMFGPPGRLYVYFTYGMHWCANVVCQPAGQADAVLLRALVPLEGLEDMRAARRSAAGAVPGDHELCRGPARLAQALGITGGDNGVDLCRSGRIALYDDGVPPPAAPSCGPRVGVAQAEHTPWRWWVGGSRYVSTYRAGRGGPRLAEALD